MEDDAKRKQDRAFKLVPSKESGKSRHPVSLEVVKSAYIAEGLSVDEIAERYHLEKSKIKALVESENLEELRRAYIRQGLQRLQSKQMDQAEKLMDLETNFKKMRILQLEDQLKDFVAYHERHGDFYKRHPKSGEILYNTNGMPMQISIPNVTKEIRDLKESVSLSEGMKTLLDRFDEVINSKPKGQVVEDVIDVTDYKALFERKDES